MRHTPVMENDCATGELSFEVGARACFARSTLDPRPGGLRILCEEFNYRRGATEPRAQVLSASFVAAFAFRSSRSARSAAQLLDEFHTLDTRPAPNDPLVRVPPALGAARTSDAAIHADVVATETQQFSIVDRHK
jgi:hypothetical protein